MCEWCDFLLLLLPDPLNVWVRQKEHSVREVRVLLKRALEKGFIESLYCQLVYCMRCAYVVIFFFKYGACTKYYSTVPVQ